MIESFPQHQVILECMLTEKLLEGLLLIQCTSICNIILIQIIFFLIGKAIYPPTSGSYRRILPNQRPPAYINESTQSFYELTVYFYILINIPLNDASQKNVYTSAGGSSSTSDLRNIISNEAHLHQYTKIKDQGKIKHHELNNLCHYPL